MYFNILFTTRPISLSELFHLGSLTKTVFPVPPACYVVSPSPATLHGSLKILYMYFEECLIHRKMCTADFVASNKKVNNLPRLAFLFVLFH